MFINWMIFKKHFESFDIAISAKEAIKVMVDLT